jgi:hypothetical protein
MLYAAKPVASKAAAAGGIGRAQHVGLRLRGNAAADHAEFEWE